MVKVYRTISMAKPEIDAAIKEAEKGTTGELVVALSRRAGDYGRQEATFAFGVALLSFVASWVLGQRILFADWTAAPYVRLGLFVTCLILLAGFLFGLGFCRAFPRFGLLLAPKKRVDSEVEAAASVAFRRLNITDTKADTGVLIYVAELERRVVVLGDCAIARKVSDQDWEAIRDDILEGIRKDDPKSGFLAGISRAGDLLRTYFPSETDTEDELPSEVHLS